MKKILKIVAFALSILFVIMSLACVIETIIYVSSLVTDFAKYEIGESETAVLYWRDTLFKALKSLLSYSIDTFLLCCCSVFLYNSFSMKELFILIKASFTNYKKNSKERKITKMKSKIEKIESDE